MIFDLEKDELPAQVDAQVCIVGGGAVGLAMATRLARSGVDVVLLEGGGRSLETRSQALQKGQSIGHPFANIEVGRYRTLGGSTTYWGGQVLPFDAFVTGERPWLGHDAWPVAEDVLSRYFEEAYGLIGLGAMERDNAAVWKSLGGAVPDLGPDLSLEMTRWLKVRNFSRLFGRALKDASGPRTYVHANVVGMEMNGDAVVHALHARALNGRTMTVRARSFILANGTLEIARLLMHPLISGRDAPWSRSEWLGRPLVDHLDCAAGEVKVLDHTRFHQIFDNIYVGGHKYYPKVRLSPEVQRAEGLTDIAAQFLYKTRFSEHLDYLKQFLRSIREGGGDVSLLKLPQHVAAVAATTVPLALRYFRDRRSFKPKDAEVTLVFYSEQLPCARSRLLLSQETDALGMRQLAVDWQIDGREMSTMKHFGRTLQREFKQRNLAEITLDPRLEAEDPSFISIIHDAVHQMGVTRMGRSAAEGFVDPDLKVFGTRNLYVAGAAVFPSTGFANPTFTAIALALRLCDHLGTVSDER